MHLERQGNMGGPMALNLSTWLHANSYPALTLWNRTTSKLPAESASISHASTLTELAQKCDIIFTSFSADEVVQSCYEELLKGAEGKKGTTIFVETSTIYPRVAGELERKASKLQHVYYLQCPVFGPPPVVRCFSLFAREASG
jgi:3-hydroxyisobutyrate dehydrogenase-like beta-hydroxyacid dehydrogenase